MLTDPLLRSKIDALWDKEKDGIMVATILK